MPAIANSGSSATDAWQRASGSIDSWSPRLGDACALLALLVQSQTTTQNGCRTAIEINAQKLEELKKELAEAIQQAKEASEHSGFLGFLGDVFGSDIAQIAGAIAAVAAVVATGGAAAAALVLIAVAEGLQVAAKVGAELGLDPKLCMALSIASVAVGLCTGTGELQAAGTLAQVGRDVEVGAKVLQSGSTMTGGALHYAATRRHVDALHYQADIVLHQANEDATNLDIDQALSMLQRALRTAQRETSTASEIVENDAETTTALSERI